VVDGYLSKEYSTGMLVRKKKKIMQTTTAKSKIHARSVSQKTHGTWRKNIMLLSREKNFLGREMAKKIVPVPNHPLKCQRVHPLNKMAIALKYMHAFLSTEKNIIIVFKICCLHV